MFVLLICLVGWWFECVCCFCGLRGCYWYGCYAVAVVCDVLFGLLLLCGLEFLFEFGVLGSSLRRYLLHYSWLWLCCFAITLCVGCTSVNLLGFLSFDLWILVFCWLYLRIVCVFKRWPADLLGIVETRCGVWDAGGFWCLRLLITVLAGILWDIVCFVFSFVCLMLNVGCIIWWLLCIVDCCLLIGFAYCYVAGLVVCPYGLLVASWFALGLVTWFSGLLVL